MENRIVIGNWYPQLEIGRFPDLLISGYILQIVGIGLENYLQWHVRIKEIRIQSL
jgi:hypothetical protein